MNKYLIFSPVLTLLILFLGCSGSKQIANTECTTAATVKDFSKLDGCKFLFVLENGKKLFADNFKELGYTPKDGDRVRISYKILENYASICLAENNVVQITCLEMDDSTPEPEKECAVVTNPTKAQWIREMELEFRPSQIIRYELEDYYAYHFMSKRQSLLFNCYGEKLCDVEGPKLTDCTAWNSKLKNPVVIWIVND